MCKRTVLLIIIVILLMLVAYSVRFRHNGVILLGTHMEEPYSAMFIEECGCIIVTSSRGIECYDATTGSYIWRYSEANMLYSSPSVVNEDLYAGQNGAIARVNVRTGKLIKKYIVEGQIEITHTMDGRSLYYVARKGTSNYLGVLQLTTGKYKVISTFSGAVQAPLVIQDNTIVISSYFMPYNRGTIQAIDINTGAIKWAKKIYHEGIRSEKYLAQHRDKLYWVNMDENEKNTLVAVDIDTGETEKLKLKDNQWWKYDEYINADQIDYDGRYIVMFDTGRYGGDYAVVFDCQNYTFTIIDEVPARGAMLSSGTIDEGRIIYANADKIYAYDIKNKKNEILYSYSSDQVYQLFALGKYVMVVQAKNVQEAVADGKGFDYKIVQMDSIH